MSDIKVTPTASSLHSKLVNGGADAQHLYIENNTLVLTPPGISIKDITDFLNKILNDFGDFGSIIPDDLPIDGIRLTSLTFHPSYTKSVEIPARSTPEKPVTELRLVPYKIAFTLSWQNAKWDMIPGVLSLESPKVHFEDNGGVLSASLSGIVEIEKIPLLIEVDLPNRTFSVSLVIDGKNPSPTALLQKFQSTPGGDAGSGQKGKGVDLGALTLDDLSILGSFNQTKRALFHIALSKIVLGHGDLALQLSLDYTGGTQSSIKGMVYGDYTVPSNNPVLDLMLVAEYDGPGQGWLFEGSMQGFAKKDANGNDTFGPSLKAMIAALEGKTEKTVSGIPAVLDEIGVKFLNLSYNTGTGDFEASCEVDTSGLFAEGAEVDFIVSVSLRRQGEPGSNTAPSYDKTFKGSLIIKLEDGLQMEFDAVFDSQGGGTMFIADYQNLGGGKVNLGSLIKAVNPNIDIPLTIGLKDAFFVYKKDAATPVSSQADPQAVSVPGSSFMLGLDINGGVNLSNLPLVGKMFSSSQTLKIDLQPIVASGPKPPFFTTAELATISGLIPNSSITFPAKDISTNVNFLITLQMGGKTFPIDLPIQLKESSTQAKPATPGQTGTPPQTPPPDMSSQVEENTAEAGKTPASPGAMATTPPPAGSSGEGSIQWLNVQKSFGPVTFNRLGVQYANKEIWAFLDASLGLAGLNLSLMGLGVGTPINSFKPEFQLHGLGLDFQAGPIEIGGYFLRTHVTKPIGDQDPKTFEPYYEYDGLATIKAEILNITAIGSYAKVNGYTSLFLYAMLDFPIGGPPFFFVTGLAAGFGYNRAVRMPSIAEVGTFPLVNEAVGGEGSKIPSDPLARQNYLQNEITKLSTSIYPKPGEYFLAAGIRFSTFELVDTFVMVAVTFGQDFEVDILGLSTLIVPTPEEGNTVPPLAELQMALKATFAPAEGFLGIQAQLTYNSFLLSRACHLTGGFAFFTWFGGEHKGDFVISLGGYHPQFQKPAWYPDVPRLGFNWVISSELSLKGELYFALCSHALMAGGRLQALFHAGPIKAWFIIGADFIISWKPYFYSAHIYLDMGVSFTFWLFGTHTISIRLGGDLKIWGPDFSGTATIHYWIISFTVSFGGASPSPKAVPWSTFKSSFLPAKDKTISLAVTDGLVKKNQDAQNGTVMVLNGKDFCIGINTSIPFSKADVDGNALDLTSLEESVQRSKVTMEAFTWDSNAKAFTQKKGTRSLSPDTHGIAPMALDHTAVSSQLSISVTKKVKTGWTANDGDLAFRPIVKQMPAAMWGETLETSTNGKRFVENAVCGFEIVPAKPPSPSETQAIPKKDLAYTTSHIDKAYAFETIQAAQAAQGSVATIADPATMQKRKAMAMALGFDVDRLGISTPAGIARDFVESPQTCILATT